MHYSYSQSPKALKEAAVYLATGIIEVIGDEPFVLVYSGFSGSALATAIALQFSELDIPEEQFGMAYVRKPKERCHGDSIEFHALDPTIIHDSSCIVVFVDDFLETGETLCSTLKNFVQKINKQFAGRFMVALSGANTDGNFYHNSPDQAPNFRLYQSVDGLREYAFNTLDLW